MGSVTALGTNLASTSNASSYVCASFTPTAGRLLFVWVTVTDATPSAPTLTDTSNSNGLTFTQVARAHKINTSNSTQEGEQYLFIANQATPGTPAAMTLTISGVTGASGCTMMMGEAASLTKVGTAAVRQFAISSDVQGGTAPSCVMAANVLTGNPIAFAAHVSVGTGSTQPTGMTERGDVTYATPTTGAEWASRDSGSTATTFTLGSASNGPCSAIAVEFDTSAGTQALTGETDAVSGAAGSIGLAAALTGEADGVSAAAGAIHLAAALTGTAAGTSAVTGAIGARLSLTGTVAGTSSTVGDIGNLLGLSGTVAATSAVGGAIHLLASLSGTVAAVTSVTGTPTALGGFTGVVEAVSDTTGDLAALLVLDGTVVAISGTSGDIGRLGAGIPVSYRITSHLRALTVRGELRAPELRGHLYVPIVEGETE